MKIELGIALALHVALLFAARRDVAHAREESSAMSLVTNIPVEIAQKEAAEEPRARVETSNPPAPLAPAKAASPGGHEASAPRPRAPEKLIRAIEASADGAATSDRPSADPIAPIVASGGDGVGGDGDGGEGGKGHRKGSGFYEDGWDAAVGPKLHEKSEPVADSDAKSLPKTTIDAAVAKSSTALRACFDEGFRRDASLSGLIPVRFVVDAAGSVVVANDAGSTIGDPTAVRCVLRAFAGMSFPARASGGPLATTYTVAFPMEPLPVQAPKHR